MKKISIVMMIALMMSSLFVFADGTKIEGSILPEPNDIALDISDGNADIIAPGETPNAIMKFFRELFGGSKNFVDTSSSEVEDGYYSCTRKSSHGSYRYDAGSDVQAGKQCSVGQYIVFTSNGGDISNGALLFDNAWLVEMTGDYVNFNKYYMKSLSFTYSYDCYECNLGTTPPPSTTPTKTYIGATCYPAPSKWLCKNAYIQDGQQYCAVSDNVNCEYGCSDGKCVDAPQSSSNIKFTSVTLPGGSDLIKGQQYEIRGTVYVTGTCDGCVIESGLDAYGKALSTVSSSSGACGDDETVGVKFNAKDEYVTFTLKDVASKTGKYRVSIVATNGCWAEKESSYQWFDSSSFVVDIKDGYVPGTTKTCYYCAGNEVMTTTTEEASCPGETSATIPTCTAPPEEEITCYYCLGTEVRSMKVKGETCPDDTQSTQPTACEGDDPEPNFIECYYCVGTEMRTTTVNGDVCSPDTFATKPNCALGDDKLMCYYCMGDTLRSVTVQADSCPDDTVLVAPSACGEPIQPDCANNPEDPACDPGEDCTSAVYAHAYPEQCDPYVGGSDWIVYAVLVVIVIASALGLIFLGGKKK